MDSPVVSCAWVFEATEHYTEMLSPDQTRPDQTRLDFNLADLILLMFTFSQHLVGGGTRTLYTFVIQGDLIHWYPPNFSTKKNTAKQPITAQDLLEQQL